MSFIVLSHILSGWWEPGTEGVYDIGDFAITLAATTAAVGLIVSFTKWLLKVVRNIIKEEIEIATQPIHPSANGGLSLADVARKTDKLEISVDDIKKTQEDLKDIMIKVLANTVKN